MESATMSTETETPRDKFAMAALTGMLANETSTDGYYSSEGAAERAYKVADAMLAERAKSQPREEKTPQERMAEIRAAIANRPAGPNQVRQPEGRGALTAKWGG